MADLRDLVGQSSKENRSQWLKAKSELTLKAESSKSIKASKVESAKIIFRDYDYKQNYGITEFRNSGIKDSG